VKAQEAELAAAWALRQYLQSPSPMCKLVHVYQVEPCNAIGMIMSDMI
jgi:hypothetical protein